MITNSPATEMQQFKMYIDGAFVSASSEQTYETINPYTGTPWARISDGTSTDVDHAVRSAQAALQGEWSETNGFDRAHLLRKLGDLIHRDAELLARIEVQETGKLHREMMGQLEHIPQWYYYFSGLADKVEGTQVPTDRSDFLVYTKREPIGVVAAIIPWNSPLLLLTFRLAPALAAGCVVVAKPSEFASASILHFANLIDEAGFPPGVCNVISGVDGDVGATLCSHPGVDKVAFTGSSETGKLVAKSAVANLSRVSLELGGKSPQIVFADAQLDAAANGIVAGIFGASGQTCVAGSRLIVHREVHDQLMDLLIERSRNIKLGDPNDPNTEMGPIANRRQFGIIQNYLNQAIREGAVVACGGEPDRTLGGLFIRPTILTNVTPNMTIFNEEVFGPVLATCTFTSDAEAIELANATSYGLAGGIWTNDLIRAHTTAARLRAGNVWVNSYRAIAPNVPFGGFGASGFGRVNGIDAISEYTEDKSVWIKLDRTIPDPFKLG